MLSPVLVVDGFVALFDGGTEGLVALVLGLAGGVCDVRGSEVRGGAFRDRLVRL